MLCMVVLDRYKKDEAEALRLSLRALFRAGRLDWDSTGVYAFWDPYSLEILYVGLDSNLSSRFARHNGLVKATGGDKRAEVGAWFEAHELLGYTVVAQSAAVRILEQAWPGETGKDIIGLGEGQLLEQHLLQHGRLPRWNSVGGSIGGRSFARQRPYTVLDLLTGQRDSLLVARRTIRHLAEDPEAQAHEVALHGARINACMEALLKDDGVSDKDIISWLSRMLTEPRWHADPQALIDLAASGYILQDPLPPMPH